MGEDRRASQTDDQDFEHSCLAGIWFKFVDSHIQHRSHQADDDIAKA